MSNRGNQLIRGFDILSTIGRWTLTTSEIIERLPNGERVSSRQIRRDLDTLCRANVIQRVPDNGVVKYRAMVRLTSQ